VAIRIELDRNFRGLYALRVGDLSGCTESMNITHEEVIQEILFDFNKLKDLFKKNGIEIE